MASLVRLAYPGGKIESLFHRLLFFPRATHYRQFCVRLAELALDLPVFNYGGRPGSTTTARQCSNIHTLDLERWIYKVLEENVLAGMVLIDALDYVMELLGRLMGDRELCDCFGPQTKKRFTEMIGNTWVEFQVPTGWELQFSGETRLEGYRGVAVIERCHLSHNTQHVNHAVGRMVGASRDERPDVGYFDIECRFFLGYRVEGNEIIRPANATGYGLGICLPFTFITREIRGEEPSLQLRTRPMDQEVIDIAKMAVDRLVDEGSDAAYDLARI
jgi:hypothetical protein